MNITLLDSEDWQKVGSSRKDEIRKAIEQAAKHAASQLDNLLSGYVNVLVHPESSEKVIPETGEGGWTHNSELIRLYFDPAFPHGYEQYLRQVTYTTHHELNHAARYFSGPNESTLLGAAINEGLATVFERDCAGSDPLWGKYKDDKTMNSWLQEVSAADDDWSLWDDFAFTHPDGRRWVAYKTGTWLIDRAMKQSGKSVLELVTLSADEIVKLAKVTG